MVEEKHILLLREKSIFQGKVWSSCYISRPAGESSFIKHYAVGHVWKMAGRATIIMPNVMPDCNPCFRRRMSAFFDDQTIPVEVPHCCNCMGWNLSSKSWSRNQVQPPKYHTTECDQASPVIPESRETFDFLINTVSLAVNNF